MTYLSQGLPQGRNGLESESKKNRDTLADKGISFADSDHQMQDDLAVAQYFASDPAIQPQTVT